MKCLFIDTSLSDVSIAIISDDKVLDSINKNIPGGHSIYTISFIDEVLKKCGLNPDDIDKILVVNGPGSFTGIRIGVTIAKTYAYVLKKEIIPVSSLKARVIGKKSNYFLSLIDARNHNYYVGLYDNNYNEVIKEQFMTLDEVNTLKEKYNPLVVAENDSLDYLAITNYYKDKPSLNPHELNPNYLKLPQALEVKKWLKNVQ